MLFTKQTQPLFLKCLLFYITISAGKKRLSSLIFFQTLLGNFCLLYLAKPGKNEVKKSQGFEE